MCLDEREGKNKYRQQQRKVQIRIERYEVRKNGIEWERKICRKKDREKDRQRLFTRSDPLLSTIYFCPNIKEGH